MLSECECRDGKEGVSEGNRNEGMIGYRVLQRAHSIQWWFHSAHKGSRSATSVTSQLLYIQQFTDTL